MHNGADKLPYRPRCAFSYTLCRIFDPAWSAAAGS
jgi:hypothetical protein